MFILAQPKCLRMGSHPQIRGKIDWPTGKVNFSLASVVSYIPRSHRLRFPTTNAVTPAKAGVQNTLQWLDSRLAKVAGLIMPFIMVATYSRKSLLVIYRITR